MDEKNIIKIIEQQPMKIGEIENQTEEMKIAALKSSGMAIKFIKLGFKLGIGGVITFKNCKLKEVIEKIDISNILLETDSPYLTPEPNRGKINSPLNLKYIAKFLSDLYNIPYDDVIKITSKNAKKVFNIR